MNERLYNDLFNEYDKFRRNIISKLTEFVKQKEGRIEFKYEEIYDTHYTDNIIPTAISSDEYNNLQVEYFLRNDVDWQEFKDSEQYVDILSDFTTDEIYSIINCIKYHSKIKN